MLLQEEPLLLQEAEPGGTGEIKPTVIGATMRVQNIISLGSTETFVNLSWLELKF